MAPVRVADMAVKVKIAASAMIAFILITWLSIANPSS
jgi:hypothetical protein